MQTKKSLLWKSKELWKSLKSLGLKFERFISNINSLKNDKSANFGVKDITKDFRSYFLKFGWKSLEQFSQSFK